MQKLAQRERENFAQAQALREGKRVAFVYTGYGTQAVRCESRVKTPGRPGVGLLVYQELRLRKRGADRASARTNEREVLERTEVTEIFRYDGKRWSY